MSLKLSSKICGEALSANCACTEMVMYFFRRILIDQLRIIHDNDDDNDNRNDNSNGM